MGNARPVPTSVGQSRAGAAQKFENDARQMLSAERALKHSVSSLYFVHVTHEPQVVFWRPAFGGSRVFFDAVKTRRVPLRTASAGDPGVAGHKPASAPGAFAPRARSPRTHASAPSRRTPTLSRVLRPRNPPTEQKNSRCSSFLSTSRPRRPDDPTRWSRCAPETDPARPASPSVPRLRRPDSLSHARQPLPSQAIIDVCKSNGDDPETVTALTLDSMCTSANVVGLEKCVALEELSMIGCGITTLEGFALPALRKLELNDNRISGGLGARRITTLESSTSAKPHRVPRRDQGHLRPPPRQPRPRGVPLL